MSTKLTKGERAGIRLIADVLVLNDLKENVFSKDTDLSKHAAGLDKAFKKASPKVFAAEKALREEIKAVREIWLEGFKAND